MAQEDQMNYINQDQILVSEKYQGQKWAIKQKCELPNKPNYSIRWNLDRWEYIPDYREVFAYNKGNGRIKTFELGEDFNDEVYTVMPPIPGEAYQQFINGKWQVNHKMKLSVAARAEIQKLESKTYRPLREISLGIEVESNKARLQEIENKIKELRIDL